MKQVLKYKTKQTITNTQKARYLHVASLSAPILFCPPSVLFSFTHLSKFLVIFLLTLRVICSAHDNACKIKMTRLSPKGYHIGSISTSVISVLLGCSSYLSPWPWDFLTLQLLTFLKWDTLWILLLLTGSCSGVDCTQDIYSYVAVVYDFITRIYVSSGDYKSDIATPFTFSNEKLVDTFLQCDRGTDPWNSSKDSKETHEAHTGQKRFFSGT